MPLYESPSEMQEYWDDLNGTEREYTPQNSLITAPFYGVFFISWFGLVGNGTVLWYLWVRISRTPFTTYVLNLAIADFMFLLFFIVTVILLWLLPTHRLIVISLPIYIMTATLTFGYQTSQFLLTTISVERCLSVVYPIWYRCHRPRNQSALVCIVLWVYCCTSAVTEALLFLTDGFCIEFYIFQAVLYFCILTPVMLLSNLFLLNSICKKSQRRRHARPYVLILSTVFAFLSLSLPFFITSYLVVFGFLTVPPIYIIPAVYSICINSGINPILYVLVGSLRRKGSKATIRQALQKAFQEDSELPQNEDGAFPQQQCLTMRSPL
ncbi:mas-related G-protein coupled receptor member H-like [Pleurodeles waltl]|uniref:mas-related G-protein coupled receptor member H-like n=1 Tax=Pleurodeles waltl TaxID=8319 RepID=UPI0037095799